MNRIITILVTIFILLLLYIWISHVWGSDKPRHPKQIVDVREGEPLGVDDMDPDVVDTSMVGGSLLDEEFENTNDDLQEAEETATQTEVKKEPVSEPVVEKKNESPKVETPVKKAEPAKPTKVVTKTSQPISSPKTQAVAADGQHLVIVGNFLQAVNANQRMEELKKAGFKDVEVVNFDLSEFHTVCAGRFDDINEARRLVKKLKDYHKIDAYVRIGS